MSLYIKNNLSRFEIKPENELYKILSKFVGEMFVIESEDTVEIAGKNSVRKLITEPSLLNISVRGIPELNELNSIIKDHLKKFKTFKTVVSETKYKKYVDSIFTTKYLKSAISKAFLNQVFESKSEIHVEPVDYTNPESKVKINFIETGFSVYVDSKFLLKKYKDSLL